MRHTLLILIVSLLSGQSKYPADSLLASSHVPIIHKIGLLPIAGWQRISYNTNFFNCVEPSGGVIRTQETIN